MEILNKEDLLLISGGNWIDVVNGACAGFTVVSGTLYLAGVVTGGTTAYIATGIGVACAVFAMAS